jgi:putative SOS response-associated peptidase YedK
MCNLYSMTRAREAILRLFRVSDNRAAAIDPQPAISPGVWTRYRGPLKKNGENVDREVFAVITTEPNELTQSINHERMPVLMSDREDFETWLSGSPAEAFKLARSCAAEQMRVVQFGADKEDLLKVN